MKKTGGGSEPEDRAESPDDSVCESDDSHTWSVLDIFDRTNVRMYHEETALPQRGRTAHSLVHDLHIAAMANHMPTLDRLLIQAEKLVTVNLNHPVNHCTVLSLALYKRRHQVFRHLMRFHTRTDRLDLNIVSMDNLGHEEPPIVTAARLRFTEAIQTLINHRIDVNVADGFGHTALWHCVRDKMYQTAVYLIKHGADVNKTDIYHCTPLYLALRHQIHPRLLRILLYCGSSILGLHTVWRQHSLLMLALNNGMHDFVALLLELGAHQFEQCSDTKSRITTELMMDNTNPYLDRALVSFTKQPLGLKCWCRHVIRVTVADNKSSGVQFVQTLESLPVPKFLRDYLLIPELNELFQDGIYF